MRTKVLGMLAAAAVLPATAVASAPTAAAAPPANDYLACFYYSPNCDYNHYSSGYMAWERTVYISGVVHGSGTSTTAVQAVFDAFQGSTKIDSEARSVTTGTERAFGFTIGNNSTSHRADRIRVTICLIDKGTGARSCGPQKNWLRIGS